ncbi:MAG: ATP-binding cassette domain-containing protein [Luminiphilus sp.]|nr:ATP-binding cassette domain-containing protein [Luminiphilus sp.]
MSPCLVIEGRLTRPRFTLDLALDVNLGHSVGVMGATGAGKTTLLRVIAGLEPHFAGRIQFGEETWSQAGQTDLVPTHRRGLGVVFQDSRLLPGRTVQENFDFAIKRAHRRASAVANDSIITGLHLEHLLAARVEGLSGGERQRVAVARALFTRPQLLLMDEPLSANDMAQRRQMTERLSEWVAADGVPLIYVSHAHDELLQLTSQVLILDHGRVTGQGEIDALRDAVGSAEQLSADYSMSNRATESRRVVRSRPVVLAKDPERGIATLQWRESEKSLLQSISSGDTLAVEAVADSSRLGASLQPEPDEYEGQAD